MKKTGKKVFRRPLSSFMILFQNKRINICVYQRITRFFCTIKIKLKFQTIQTSISRQRAARGHNEKKWSKKKYIQLKFIAIYFLQMAKLSNYQICLFFSESLKKIFFFIFMCDWKFTSCLKMRFLFENFENYIQKFNNHTKFNKKINDYQKFHKIYSVT